MKATIAKTLIPVAIVALEFSAYPIPVQAGELGGTADKLQRACTVAAGRFEQGWLYNDSGVQWDEITSCVTESVRLTCQDDTCSATSLDRSGRTAVLVKQKASGDLGVKVPAEKDEFDRVLKSMAMY